jgi:hypothetical protein
MCNKIDLNHLDRIPSILDFGFLPQKLLLLLLLNPTTNRFPDCCRRIFSDSSRENGLLSGSVGFSNKSFFRRKYPHTPQIMGQIAAYEEQTTANKG